MLAAGQRDRLVTIKVKPAEDTAPTGFPVETFTDADPATDWMARRDLRADERYALRQESAYAETQWHGSYRTDMDPELLDVPATRALSYQGRIYDIISAAIIGNKEGIEYMTLAGSKV